MTIEELIWKLRAYDDDIEVEVFHPHEERFSEPRIEMDEVEGVAEDGHSFKRWRMRLIGKDQY